MRAHPPPPLAPLAGTVHREGVLGEVPLASEAAGAQAALVRTLPCVNPQMKH